MKNGMNKTKASISKGWILDNFQVEFMVMAVGPNVLTYMQFHPSVDIARLLKTIHDILCELDMKIHVHLV